MSTKPHANNNGLAEDAPKPGGEGRPKPVIIKKYANRRLYNTGTSAYVTLDDLAEMVRKERDFEVYDAKTGEDLTHSVLTQIIVEQESKSEENLLPIGFLRQLIRFYGNSMERLVPSYLEYSLNTLTREQDKYRQQFADTFGAAAFATMQEQTLKNLAVFGQALNMFSPFTSFEAHGPSMGRRAQEHAAPAQPKASEIDELKTQLASIQAQLNELAAQK
jgi:polyhydroxyalkanoate synthesis repressor PhaR